MIGIDAGGTKLLGGVVDEGLGSRNRIHRLWRGGDTQEVLDIIVDAAMELREAAPDAAAVGIGIPSLVDHASGTSVSSVHLPLANVPVRDILSERLVLPVVVDNDANCAALAEQRAGAGRGAAHVVMLTLGTGIGGGLVLGGRLYRGAAGAGAELGHMVVDLDGPACQGACPNRGCLEAFASGRAIGQAGAEAARAAPESALGRALARGSDITGALVTELAHDGDAAAVAVLEAAGRRLGVGIANLVNVFNPQVVVVGGGAAAAGELLLAPAREEMLARALPPSRDLVRVVAAGFGDESGLVGAGLLALEEGGAA